MTSKDPEIQHIYDRIKEFKTTQPYKCICVKKCDYCLDHTKAMESNLPTAYELEMLVKRLTGVEYGFNSRTKFYPRMAITPFLKVAVSQSPFP